MRDGVQPLTHGSLFAGIGGFDLGFERAGIKTVWQVEIDPYCRAVLAKHFPEAERFEDVRRVTGLPRVDVISGGFPCQDISVAGKRVGIEGERSGLWREMWRVICDVRPRFVVVENVAALLYGGIEQVLGDLAAGGFAAEWDCIPAFAVGAPHRRDRIWIVAYPESDLRRASGNERPEASDGCGSDMAYANSGRCESRSECTQERGIPVSVESGEVWRRSANDQTLPDSESIGSEVRIQQQGRRFSGQDGPQGNLANTDIQPQERITESWRECNPWLIEPNVGRVAHGIPARVDRLKGLGNAVIPQIAEWIGRRIVEADKVRS